MQNLGNSDDYIVFHRLFCNAAEGFADSDYGKSYCGRIVVICHFRQMPVMQKKYIAETPVFYQPL